MIPAHELYQQHVHRQHGRMKTYDVVLKRLENRIVQTSNMDQYECTFQVPSFIMGEPMFALEDCMLYLYMKLHRNGYKVQMHPPNLHVSWRRYDDAPSSTPLPLSHNAPSPAPSAPLPLPAPVPLAPDLRMENAWPKSSKKNSLSLEDLVYRRQHEI
jgi:hypothetical protein